jgi:hypothetical protein
MATFQDLLKTLGGGALQGGQKLVKSAQDAIVNWAAKNPTQATGILQATGGSFGSMIQKSPVAVAKAIAPTVKQIAQQAVAPKAAVAAVKPPPVVQKIAAPPPKPIVQKQSFGDIMAAVKPVVQQKPVSAGGGPSQAMVLAGQSVPSPTSAKITPASINPKTGLPYAINPSTGLWDEDYFNRVWSTYTQGAAIPSTVLDTIKKYALSGVSEKEAERLAMEELKPYYEKKLAESNWDFDTARKQMEEDRALEIKQGKENILAQQQEFFGTTAPQEQLQLQDALASRGILTTREGAATPLTGTTATGEQLTAKSPFTAGYGGIAGRRIGTLVTSQKARADAIARGLSQREESLGLQTKQSTELMTEQQKRSAAALEEARKKEAASLGTSKYQRALTQAQLKTQEALGPYLG